MTPIRRTSTNTKTRHVGHGNYHQRYRTNIFISPSWKRIRKDIDNTKSSFSKHSWMPRRQILRKSSLLQSWRSNYIAGQGDADSIICGCGMGSRSLMRLPAFFITRKLLVTHQETLSCDLPNRRVNRSLYLKCLPSIEFSSICFCSCSY